MTKTVQTKIHSERNINRPVNNSQLQNKTINVLTHGNSTLSQVAVKVAFTIRLRGPQRPIELFVLSTTRSK